MHTSDSLSVGPKLNDFEVESAGCEPSECEPSMHTGQDNSITKVPKRPDLKLQSDSYKSGRYDTQRGLA